MDVSQTTQQVHQAVTPAVQTTKQRLVDFFSSQNIGTVEIIQTASLFGVGFLVGMVLKKSLKYLVFLIVTLTIILALGVHFSLMHFNVQAIKALLGLQQVTSLEVFFSLLFAQMRAYWLESVGLTLGFLIGCKAG